jgi:hypothetical protein
MNWERGFDPGVFGCFDLIALAQPHLKVLFVCLYITAMLSQNLCRCVCLESGLDFSRVVRQDLARQCLPGLQQRPCMELVSIVAYIGAQE